MARTRFSLESKGSTLYDGDRKFGKWRIPATKASSLAAEQPIFLRTDGTNRSLHGALGHLGKSERRAIVQRLVNRLSTDSTPVLAIWLDRRTTVILPGG